MEWQVILTLFGTFAFLLAIGVPVSFAIGLSSLATILMSLPLEPAIAVVAQRMAAGLITLLCWQFRSLSWRVTS